MSFDTAIIVVLIVAALGTVLTTRLLRAAIGLAFTSAVLSLVLYRLHAPLAAVFELSVGAGLIPAIFLSVISMTERMTPEILQQRRKSRLGSYWALPIIVALLGVALTQVHWPTLPPAAAAEAAGNAKAIVWNVRNMDLLGQVLLLLSGAFGVVVLVKELKS